MPAAFHIKGEKGAYLNIIIHKYELSAGEDSHDSNWLACEVLLSSGAFRARYNASFQTSAFLEFNKRLAELYLKLEGAAEFKTLEEQLNIKVTGDGKGHMTADCIAIDEAGTGNRLEFKIELDQTHLKEMLYELDGLIKKYPVR